MAHGFKVTMMLADSAQAVGGKLYILGGGWDITGPGAPSAIALKIDVPWDQANRKHHVELALEDADGRPLNVPQGDGFGPLKFEGELEVGRPAGVAEGTPLSWPAAFNMGPLPLTPGSRYVWRLSIDGPSEPHWQVPFAVRNVDLAQAS